MKLERIGILDPDGKKLNPLTGEKYTPDYYDFARGGDGQGGWASLPMYSNPRYPPEDIIKDIMEYQVLVIEAGTGNGKSVLVPKYALHATDYQGKIVVTNPNRFQPKIMPSGQQNVWMFKSEKKSGINTKILD